MVLPRRTFFSTLVLLCIGFACANVSPKSPLPLRITLAAENRDAAPQTSVRTLDSCSQYTTCESCTNQTLCHFCAFDQQCHAYLSPYGCGLGVSCSDIKQCFRFAPEFKQYGRPENSVIGVGILLAAFCLTIPLLCIVFLSPDSTCCRCVRKLQRAYQKELLLDDLDADSETSTASGATDLELQQNGGRGSVRSPDLPAGGPGYFPLSSFSQPLGKSAGHSSANGTRSVSQTTLPPINNKPNQPTRSDQPSPRARKGCCCFSQPLCSLACLHRACRMTFLIALILVVPVTTVGVLYYPQMPQYSMCSRHVPWGTILTNLAQGSLFVDAEMQFSVYNPNRFSVELNTARAEVFFEGSVVATGVINDVSIGAGDIQDYVATMRVAPGVANTLRMLTAYAVADLLIEVRLSIDSNIFAFRRNLLHYNASVDVTTSTYGDWDRSWCKCQ